MRRFYLNTAAALAGEFVSSKRLQQSIEPRKLLIPAIEDQLDAEAGNGASSRWVILLYAYEEGACHDDPVSPELLASDPPRRSASVGPDRSVARSTLAKAASHAPPELPNHKRRPTGSTGLLS